MNHYYPSSLIEEGVNNLVYQNRCGNRLSMMFHQTYTECEITYKPNAFRRKEFRARNFSNRDIFTTIFASCTLPEIGSASIQYFGYDPFITKIHTRAGLSQAQNILTILNFPHQNCFALAARHPLLILVKPHVQFNLDDGLITEMFIDRGERIVSFLAFPGFEENRIRQLPDATIAIQIMDEDIVIMGAEESLYQVQCSLKILGNKSLSVLTKQVEQDLSAPLQSPAITSSHSEWQHSLNFNKRVLFSQIDAGGACIAALNRIYHLQWIRDGGMACSYLAKAGAPSLLALWTPFLLDNPSRQFQHGGHTVNEFLQIVGTRWTKTEDDGLYYAVLSLYTLYQTTGNPIYLDTSQLVKLVNSMNYVINTKYDTHHQLFMSQTRGEILMSSSPLFGYDPVNGTLVVDPPEEYQHKERRITHLASLYQNSNMYNVLCMLIILLDAAQIEHQQLSHYYAFTNQLKQSLQSQFINQDGLFYSSLLFFDNDTTLWDAFEEGDVLEYTWAVTLGPFFFDTLTTLRSAYHLYTHGTQVKPYNYSAWNTLSHFLKEWRLPDKDFETMITSEIDESGCVTTKYPMTHAIIEYQQDLEGWRGLPFCIAPLITSVTALLLQSLPQGLAVRASMLVDSVTYFQYRTCVLHIVATDIGEEVHRWLFAGRTIECSLQIPERWLVMGSHQIQIVRGSTPRLPRLYSSNARLLDIYKQGSTITLEFFNAVPSELVFEGIEQDTLHIYSSEGDMLIYEQKSVTNDSRSLIFIEYLGNFTILIKHTQ